MIRKAELGSGKRNPSLRDSYPADWDLHSVTRIIGTLGSWIWHAIGYCQTRNVTPQCMKRFLVFDWLSVLATARHRFQGRRLIYTRGSGTICAVTGSFVIFDELKRTSSPHFSPSRITAMRSGVLRTTVAPTSSQVLELEVHRKQSS
ncbi:hypothetical protein D9611_009419 [Ephemerocybe angulata]|uniref:Uncharacterized protein n=1 Tax=Ephemerocybe angulata TaxID=980116 RepID=A0A8H5ETE1_9AGAR|nr:hypothetical protein D9611_009419 [Tulosesus angulatus]